MAEELHHVVEFYSGIGGMHFALKGTYEEFDLYTEMRTFYRAVCELNFLIFILIKLFDSPARLASVI